MNVYIYTLGCRLNQAESEAIADSFSKAGFPLTSSTDADLVIVNSCTVTTKAEQKARRMIRLFAKHAEVIVTGCYAELNKEEVASLSDKVTVFSLKEKASLLKLASHLSAKLAEGYPLHDAIVSFTYRSDDPFAFDASSFQYHSRAYLKIQDGCDNSCGYCRVHIARGASRSLDRSEVIRRALELEGEGFNEIVLTGVNLTMYDHENEGLGGLMLSLIPRLKGTTRLRLSSMEPDHVDERLIEACSSPAVHPHFHIPVQSASDRVLQRSSRRYSRAMSWASSAERSTASGQPPRQARSTSFVALVSTWEGANSPRKSPERDTARVESPDSERVIGRILTWPILPAPLWLGCSSGLFASLGRGVEEPVSIHAPLRPRTRSASCRTTSHIAGTRCHSSMTCGRSPSSIIDGSALATARLSPWST